MDRVDMSLNLDTAMVNSYKFIMGLKDIDELFEENPEALLLVFDPDEYSIVVVINDLLEYFEETEEYEYCANLKKIKLI